MYCVEAPKVPIYTTSESSLSIPKKKTTRKKKANMGMMMFSVQDEESEIIS